MSSTGKEVLDLIFEFLISVLVIGGGGILMSLGIGDNTFLTSMMALVIYFWFQSRSNAATVNNLLKQFPVNPPTPIDPNCPPTTQTLPGDTSPPVNR